MAVAIPFMMYAAVAASAASAYMSYDSSKKNAEAQTEQQEIHNRETAKAIDANYGELSKVEQDALLNEADDNIDLQKQFMQARGRVNTMAAASGTAGQSIDAQMLGLSRDRQTNLDSIQATRQSKLDNVTNQARQIKSQGTASMDYSPISRPSWAQGALSVASTTLSGVGNAYGASQKLQMAQQVNTPKAGG
ncbi:hypothetical protein [Pseudomonas phage Nerthus]|uniref:Internal virion protein n=1 Tax=Pseudomonas phage Nerthus TaxID=2163984 RepID=A0A2S1GMQ9_9CAUD|nr:internal virion protein [Pseudomonas phage Nerthus]AWD90665.1 hypothetical protein [Pseudomonas phage Nerthus]